jgi:hypothetical protein
MSAPFFQESTPVPGRRYAVADGATVGRGSADIVLADPQVSRVHARLVVDGAAVSVEDLGSRNGTFVNETRIQAATALREGDTLRMGDTVWRFFTDTPVEAPGMSEPADRAARNAVAADLGVRRGDVPAPDPIPSGVRVALMPDAPGEPSFAEPRRRPRRRVRSAARSTTATLLSYAVIVATAVAVVLYLALR